MIYDLLIVTDDFQKAVTRLRDPQYDLVPRSFTRCRMTGRLGDGRSFKLVSAWGSLRPPHVLLEHWMFRE